MSTITKKDVEKCIKYLEEMKSTYESSYGKKDRKAEAYGNAAEYLRHSLLSKFKNKMVRV